MERREPRSVGSGQRLRIGRLPKTYAIGRYPGIGCPAGVAFGRDGFAGADEHQALDVQSRDSGREGRRSRGRGVPRWVCANCHDGILSMVERVGRPEPNERMRWLDEAIAL